MADRIMVINDSVDFLDVMKELLEEEGYAVQVLHARPERELEAVVAAQPNLIVLDLMFGSEPSGWLTLELLKLDPRTTHIPVILCSAAVSKIREVADILPERGVHLVYKPFDIETMLASVREALRGHPS